PHRRPDLRRDPLRQQRAPVVRTAPIAPWLTISSASALTSGIRATTEGAPNWKPLRDAGPHGLDGYPERRTGGSRSEAERPKVAPRASSLAGSATASMWATTPWWMVRVAIAVTRPSRRATTRACGPAGSDRSVVDEAG